MLLDSRSEPIPNEHIKHWRGEEQRVDAVEYAAVAGNRGGRIFHADAALQERFEEIAEDTEGHNRQSQPNAQGQRNVREPPVADDRDREHAADKSANGAFNGLLRTHDGRERMAAEPSARVVLRGVAD